MSKDNSTFFARKKIWSQVKDKLLGCYLTPYIQKVITTHKPIFYVDCFAGKGKFDDGSNGSPIIALEIIKACLERTRATISRVETGFIDLKYADDLKKNLQGYPHCQIVSGSYENNIKQLLEVKNGYNVLLYIDPYGIKSLKFGLFDIFTHAAFNSLELLINLNSFGFMRAACRAKRVDLSDVEGLEDIIELEPSIFDSTKRSIETLNEIAGGNYWEKIVDDYRKRLINGYEAEEKLSKQYCFELGKKFKYVLNMPIRLRKGQRPKYRMIHATNHPDGCILMYDNMCSCWEVLEEMQTGGQGDLFNVTVENDIVEPLDIEKRLKEHIEGYKNYIRLNEFMAEFFTEQGILCKKKEIIALITKLEKNGNVIVRREPEKTPLGKMSTFYTESTNHKVYIRRK